MSISAKDLLAIAAAEIGYKEKASNSNLDDKAANAGHNNWTKYARDLYAKGYYNGNKNGYAWCDVFVDWCFLQLCGGDAAKAQYVECQSGPYGAGCDFSHRYYKEAGRYDTTDPRPGDQIFFGDFDHTGIIESVTATTINTIEGNTSDQVARRSYSRTSSYVTGFGHPRYETDDAPAVQPTEPAPSPDPVPADGRLKLGDKVKMAANAPVYGKSYKFASWVYSKELFVRGVDGDKISVSIYASGDVTGTVDRKYLTLVGASTVEPDKPTTDLTHTVVKGDSLWGIAQRYLGKGNRYPEIVSLNGLKSTLIYPGQVLKLPNK